MPLIGRESELRRLEAALDGVTAARTPIGIRIEGPAGIGKSTIWRGAVDVATGRGWRVLTARAAASESNLTLGVLADLLAPVDDATIAELPRPQHRALDVALLRADPDADADVDAEARVAAGAAPVEGRVLGTAVRTVLAALAAEQPVLVAVDDVQWADAASLAALTYAIRRLAGSQVALLLARRVPQALPFDPVEVMASDRWTVIEVGAMPLGSINELLRERGWQAPSRATLVRIHQASGGNPLFALEIARVLATRGEPPAGEPLPVPADMRELLRERLAATPEPARQVLLDLAILGTADEDRLAAIEGRAVGAELASAEREGLIRSDAGGLAFAHPLYAAAAMAVASPANRRSAHGRIAATASSAEERARHRALATGGPDEAIATDLDQAAVEARARGAPLAAAELLRLAIERTPTGDIAALGRRQLLLAQELKRAGDAAGAIRELEAVGATAAPAVRAQAYLDLAGIRYETDGGSGPAVALANAALVEAAGDPALEARAYAVLAAVDWDDLRNHDRYVREGLRRIAMVSNPDPLTEVLLLGVRCGSDFRAGRPLDPVLIDRALELDRIAPTPAVSDRFSASLGTWLKWLDRFDEARVWLERTRQTAIDEGDEGSLPYALAHLPELEVWTGHWDRADAIAREHLALADASALASQREQALYNLAMVHVHQGRVGEARAEIAEAVAATEASGDGYLLSGVLPFLGLLELSLGYPAAAVIPLERSFAIRNDLGADSPWRPGADLVEALVAVGSLDRATEVQADLEARIPSGERLSYRANAARSRGLLLAASGQLEAARAALDEALALHAAAPIAFDRARTLLALGQVRRRLRERGAARDAFDDARRVFDGLGAGLWAARAAAELERTGLRRGAGHDLTEAERRVAELAASGMTNHQVAAALFMSPKTVGANLGRVYAKLGIRSRAELGAAIGRRTGTAEAAQT